MLYRRPNSRSSWRANETLMRCSVVVMWACTQANITCCALAHGRTRQGQPLLGVAVEQMSRLPSLIAKSATLCRHATISICMLLVGIARLC